MQQEIIFHQRGKDDYHNIWHTIGRNMIIYIHSGSGRIVCSEKSYPIEEGVLCFIGAHKFHYTLSDDPSCYDRSKVFADSDGFHRLLQLFPEQLGMHKLLHADALVYAQLKGEEAIEAERLFAEIAAYQMRGKYADTVLLADYTRLLVLLDRNILESIAPSAGHIYKAIEYINSHITEELKIEEICAAVPISKYYFCREFKKAMGLTVMEYILKTRLTLAQTMLIKEKASISEISESCGFSSISYFCRVFKQELGMAPSHYRRGILGE